MTNKKNWLFDLLTLTLLIGIFFSIFLGTRSLAVPDEARYSEIPREMLVTHDYVTPHINFIKYFEKPPLFYWMQAGAIHLFGHSEWSVRLINALLALIGCLMTYCAGRKLYNRRTGWLAAIILATSILYYGMARFITLDMTVSVWLTGCLFSFILGVGEPPGKKRNYYMWSMFFFSALTTLTKGLIGIIFPGAIIFLWLLLLNDWRSIKTYCLPTGILLWLIIVLPWHVLVQLRNPEFFNFYIIDQQFERYLTPYAHRGHPFWYLPVTLVLGFFPWILFLPQTIKHHWPALGKKHKQRSETLWLMLWIVFIYLFFALSHSQLPPYILPIFPPLAVLTANYLAAAWQQYRAGIRNGLIIFAIIIILTIIGMTLFLEYWASGSEIIYIRSAALFLLGIALCPLISYRFGRTRAGISILIICTAALLTSANLIHPLFEQKSVKPLALQLKPLLNADDRVISYHGYYQDLPYYLQRRIGIVGWGDSELDFGMQHQNMQEWLLDDATLWQDWQTSQRIFLFMSRKSYNDLLTAGNQTLCLLGGTARNVVVTNHCSPDIQLKN